MAANSKERWRQIIHPTHGAIPFDVSNHDRIRSRTTHSIRPLYANCRTGYISFRWRRERNGRRMHSSILVAPAVCRAFKKKPKPPGYQIEHWDQNKANNRLDNLKYVSQSANIQRNYNLVGRRKMRPFNHYTQAGHDLLCALWQTGRFSQMKIGRACGITNGSVSQIVRGKQGVSRYAHTDIHPNWSVLESDPVQQARLIAEVAEFGVVPTD